MSLHVNCTLGLDNTETSKLVELAKTTLNPVVHILSIYSVIMHRIEILR